LESRKEGFKSVLFFKPNCVPPTGFDRLELVTNFKSVNSQDEANERLELTKEKN